MFLEKQPKRLRWQNRNNISILIACCCLVGCEHVTVAKAAGSKPYIHSINDYLPLNGDKTPSIFTVDGTKTNYKLKTVESGTTVSFQVLSEGKLIGEEVYDVVNNSICLNRAAGEAFSPAIVLMKFPLNVGDESSWKGKLVCEMDEIDASATIRSSTDFVPMKDRSDDAIKVEIDLNFSKGGNRKLSFWMVKGKGIVKTEMFKTTREPKR